MAPFPILFLLSSGLLPPPIQSNEQIRMGICPDLIKVTQQQHTFEE